MKTEFLTILCGDLLSTIIEDFEFYDIKKWQHGWDIILEAATTNSVN